MCACACVCASVWYFGAVPSAVHSERKGSMFDSPATINDFSHCRRCSATDLLNKIPALLAKKKLMKL